MHTVRARGIDHLGLTVPDISAAHRFLIDGLGAELSVTSLRRCRLWETCSNGDILHVDACGGLLRHPMDTDAT